MGDVVELKRAGRVRLPKDKRVKVQLDQEQVAFVDGMAFQDRCSRSAAIARVLTERMIEAQKKVAGAKS